MELLTVTHSPHPSVPGVQLPPTAWLPPAQYADPSESIEKRNAIAYDINFILGVDMSKIGAGIVVQKSFVTLAIVRGTRERFKQVQVQVST